MPDIDLFASRLNHQLPVYVSRALGPPCPCRGCIYPELGSSNCVCFLLALCDAKAIQCFLQNEFAFVVKGLRSPSAPFGSGTGLLNIAVQRRTGLQWDKHCTLRTVDEFFPLAGARPGLYLIVNQLLVYILPIENPCWISVSSPLRI